jgi:VWFA-related protein
MRLAPAGAVLAAAASLALAQEAASPRFPSEVELVTVDTVVLDKDGRPVTGLTASDFTLAENGVPQTMASFEAVVVPAAPPPSAPAPRPPFSTNVGPEVRHGRTYLLVFDDIHLSPGQAHRAKAAAAEFLRSGVAPGDRVTLIATGGGAWWNARMPEGRDQLLAILQRLDGRYVPDSSPDKITEFEALRIEIYQDIDVAMKVKRRFDAYGAVGQERAQGGPQPRDQPMNSGYGIIDPVVRSRATEVYQLALSRNKITLGVLSRALGALAGTRGRKAAVLLSQGFVYDTEMKEMKQAVEASRRANTPVYFVDTRGLGGLPEAMTAAFGRPLEVQDTVAVLADVTRDAEGSEALALDTGGFVAKNTNDLSRALLRVSAESRAYYLLGYVPTDLRRDGSFRKIEVKLKGPRRGGLKVRARRGYYAPLEGALAAKASGDQPDIVQALESPFEVEEVPLRLGAYVFDEVLLDKANVTLVAEVDVSGFAFREADGRLHDTMAFLLEAQHRETGEYYRYDQKVEMALLPATQEKLRRTWYPVSREFSLPPGGYQVKVVVRDMNGGRVGSVIHDFEVPATGAFRVSTPILAESVEKADGGPAPKPVIQLRRSFAPGSVLYCQFAVYGASKEPGGRMPRVTSGYEIRRADGSLLKRADPTLIRPTSLGALLRLHGISLATATPGAYDLVLSVRDEVTGKSLELREPFLVEAGAAPPAATPAGPG